MELGRVGGDEPMDDLVDHVVGRLILSRAAFGTRGLGVDLSTRVGEVVGQDLGGVEGGGEVFDEVWAIRGSGAAIVIPEGVGRGWGRFLEPVEAGCSVRGAKDEELFYVIPT